MSVYFGVQDASASSHLFDGGVVEEDPFGGFGVEGKGTVVAAGVTNHPHQEQLSLFCVLVCHPVEELRTHTHISITLFGSNEIEMTKIHKNNPMLSTSNVA
jgi:hypothetical protein